MSLQVDVAERFGVFGDVCLIKPATAPTTVTATVTTTLLVLNK